MEKNNNEQQKNVLIIEDDTIFLKLLSEEFTDGGFSVSVAADGQLGLKTALEQKPHIIILDLNLPKMNGLEVLENLRHDEWGKSVPIIILTISAPDDDIVKSITQTEPSYYLVKANVVPADVVQKANELIKGSL